MEGGNSERIGIRWGKLLGEIEPLFDNAVGKVESEKKKQWCCNTQELNGRKQKSLKWKNKIGSGSAVPLASNSHTPLSSPMTKVWLIVTVAVLPLSHVWRKGFSSCATAPPLENITSYSPSVVDKLEGTRNASA